MCFKILHCCLVFEQKNCLSPVTQEAIDKREIDDLFDS